MSRSHENTGTRSRSEVSGRPISTWPSCPPCRPGVHCGRLELLDTQESREERIARALELAEREVEKWQGALERLADK